MTLSQGDGAATQQRNSYECIIQAMSTVLGVSTLEIKQSSNNVTFVKLGGDSLSAILISAECEKSGIYISSNAFLRIAPIQSILMDVANSAQYIAMPLPKESPPVSHAITEETRGAPGSPPVTTGTMTVSDLSYKVEDVGRAWRDTILAEPIFQTLLRDMGVLTQRLFPWDIIAVDTDDEYEREAYTAAHGCDSISRLTIIALGSSNVTPMDGARSTTVIWRIHHAFIDGYSARILIDKVSCTLREGTKPVGGPCFRETLRSLRLLQEQKKASTKRFWEEKSREFPFAVGELLLSPQRTAKTETSHAQGSFTIQVRDERMAAATAETGLTTTVYFAAAWSLTLAKFMDLDQVCFGVVLSGRDLPIPGAFGAVGPLINILPLLVRVPAKEDTDMHIGEFLRQVQDGMLGLSAMQHSPVPEELNMTFNTILATQVGCDNGEPLPIPVPLSQDRLDMQSGVPLSIMLEQQCLLKAFYSTDSYSPEDMGNVQLVFEYTINRLLDASQASSVSTICERLPRSLEDEIKYWGNCESSESLDSSKDDDLVTLFENVVARHPSDVAIAWGEETISYNDLDLAAGVVARRLGWVEPNEIICVYADQSVEWIIAIFGVLKAGAAYAPLDPSAPVPVRRANFERTGARAVVYPSQGILFQASDPANAGQRHNTPHGCLSLVVDELLLEERAHLHCGSGILHPRRRIARPDDLAYVCFTSGSTGQPKAVQCTHKGLVAFPKDPAVRLGASRGMVVARLMSPVFDGSIHEVFSALTYGATLRLASRNTSEHPFSHLQDCDSAVMTPSIANALQPDRYSRLKNVYLVGEPVPQIVCDAWSKSHTLYNMYGPTEATCGATVKRLLPNKPVNLGKPNPSTRVYILDRMRRFLPPGTVGELYLAGIQVSLGYIGLPELNSSSFMVDSILPHSQQMMYKTGDYGYWNSETGEICIVGRKDRQIKLRGFRLDLDDLEARASMAIPECRAIAIVRLEDHLIAACEASLPLIGDVNEMAWKERMGEVLPLYAMPSRMLNVGKFPLTTAGKLDYMELQALVSSKIVDSASLPPSQSKKASPTEKMIIDAIYDLAGINRGVAIDPNSNITALGGHSILQLRLASRLSSLTRRRLTVRKIIENPLISHLASAIDAEAIQHSKAHGNASSRRSPIRIGRNGVYMLGDSRISPIELYWFQKYCQNLGTSSFNVSHVTKLHPSFGRHQDLIMAWNKVLSTHSILRCRFREPKNVGDGTVRSYAKSPPRALYVEVLDPRKVINMEFHLEIADPIRVTISKGHMVVCVSHIICDYTTLNQLFKEFVAAFLAMNDDIHGNWRTPVELPGRRYQETTCWENETDKPTAEFWESYLSGMDHAKLPPHMKSSRTTYAGQSLVFKLTDDASSCLDKILRPLSLTPHQLVLAMVSLVLQVDHATKDDLILGSPYLGRQEMDMRTIGLFLQPLPIRIWRRAVQSEPGTETSSLEAFFRGVQRSASQALSHGIEWGALMDILWASEDAGLCSVAARQMPNHPLFDTMVSFHGLPRGAEQASSVSVANEIADTEDLLCWSDGSKFGLMFEFSAVSDSSLTLRIEYDTTLFSAKDVRQLARRVNTGMKWVAENPTYSQLEELEFVLQSVDDGEIYSLQEVNFGTALSEI
ncbi:nonribosomal peptide synthase GliP-like protein [Apiospora kogelbergensis]|uniref:Nonribosomal peptide synthase GliP-like protein n=1 Tax=Apiospora kogelbergensis TaxID=1337665 RepID=A0AAW0Q5V5_9PEZI